MGSDSGITIKEYIDPILKHPRFDECSKNNKITVSWGQFDAQSRSLDGPFPHQSRENAIVFNENIARHFKETSYSGINIHVIDWWNFTRDAQTSDGFHYLSDINVFKAYHVLNLAFLARPNQ
jgi:hypothetical protein